MPVILFEGPDGGGKTHTAKTLFPQYQYQHNGPPPKGGPSDTFWWQLEGLLPRMPEVFQRPPVKNGYWCVDRNWPSEQIYHRFAGRPHVFHPFAQRMFERYMLAHQGIVVICLPPYEVAYKEWRKRADEGKELLTTEEEFATMYEFYRSWEQSTSLPVFIYDYTGTNKWHSDQNLKSVVVAEHGEEWRNPAPGIVWGSPQARILIVGEQYNVNGRPQGPHIPFVGTGRNGFWLSHQLELLGIPESELAWVNAVQPNGKWTKLNLLDFNFRLVIGLGATAKEWLEQFRSHQWPANLDYLFVPHPAFWTRFKSKEQWPLHDYKVLLREVAGV